jgi:hypothetical protein
MNMNLDDAKKDVRVFFNGQQIGEMQIINLKREEINKAIQGESECPLCDAGVPRRPLWRGMTEVLKKLDGSNEHLQTKDDLKANLDKVNMFTAVLKALALGVEVKLENRFIVMVEGQLYIKGMKYDTKMEEASSSYLGFGHMPYSYFIPAIEREIAANPEWLENLKAETAVKMVMNNLDKKWIGVGD